MRIYIYKENIPVVYLHIQIYVYVHIHMFFVCVYSEAFILESSITK